MGEGGGGGGWGVKKTGVGFEKSLSKVVDGRFEYSN